MSTLVCEQCLSLPGNSFVQRKQVVTVTTMPLHVHEGECGPLVLSQYYRRFVYSHIVMVVRRAVIEDLCTSEQLG